MSSTTHPQGTFSRVGEEWLAAIESGQGRTPQVGDHATLHRRSGDLARVTLTANAGQRPLGKFGRVVYLFRFTDGWGSTPRREVSITEPGVYLRDGSVHRVQRGNSGRLYAKTMDLQNGGWQYAPGAVYSLEPGDRLTLEQAKQLGHAWGRCVVCGATLTDPKSIASGIGPVCASRV